MESFSVWRLPTLLLYRILFGRVPLYKTIVIVGAGMAGLGAACQLEKLDFEDFLVIEAQNQPGGRIRTITADGKSLDIGAQWLHGKDNPLYDLALRHNLLAESLSEEGLGKYIRNDGVIFDEFLVKIVDWEVGRILEECQTFVHKQDFPSSVGEFLTRKFKEYLNRCDDTNEVREMKLQLLDWHVRFQIIDNACDCLEHLSAKWWGAYICEDDTAHYNLKHGYKSLVDVIVDSIPRHNMVYNTPLHKIQINGPCLELTCDNQTIVCDHLILTPSIGILKQFRELTPYLTQSLKETVTNIGFHSIGKIYLFFSEKWWGGTKGFQLLWDSEEELTENEKWIRCVSGFEEVFDHPNCLLGWVGGSGVEVMEEMCEEEIGAVCVNILRKFLIDWRVPDPSKVIRTKWLSDPWIKGSYCHITPECDQSDLGTSKLSDPVFVDDVPRILLAGEAVHSSHYSTTHGAFESGQQQATFLYNFIKDVK